MTEDSASRTKPVGLARYATEFYDTALAADDKLGRRHGDEIVLTPIMYLIAHSIELILKAFLLHKGLELAYIRKTLGHDLTKIVDKTRELDPSETIVSLSGDDIKTLELLNSIYKSKELNYISTGARTIPAFGSIQSLAARLITSITPIVGYDLRNSVYL